MKRYRTAAAIAMLIAVVPAALADWETTQWGMSPQDALAALDGAKAYEPAPEEVYQEAGQDYAPLVKMPHAVGGIEGDASLLFDAEQRLHSVMFNPADLADCEALGAALAEQHGPADAVDESFMSISDWVGDGNAIKLTSFPSAGICNLSYSRP